MEILVTRAFLEGARKDPASVVTRVEELLERDPGGQDFGGARMGDSRVLAWQRAADRLELVALAGEEPSDPDYPLADLSQSDLRALGVDEVSIPRVQLVRRVAELDALPLTEAVLSRLRFRLLQKRATGPLDRRAESLAHLESFLRGDIAELLLNLDETQRPIVELPSSGPIIVRGVAGSGKTAVALHRIHALVTRGSRLFPPRILYLTFNRSLAAAATDLLRSMGIAAGAVEVKNLHRWCREFLGAAAPRTILPAKDRMELIAEAAHRVRTSNPTSKIWKCRGSFWDEEIHRIQGRVLGGAGEYLSMERLGAGRSLEPRARRVVWSVYEAYRSLCADRRAADWDDLIRLALEKQSRPGESLPAYDHVFVDEAQDFTPVALRLAAALAGPAGNLVVSFDPAQSIYERGFRWKRCGIAAHGSRSFALRKNHRNTREILEFATPLLDAIRSDPAEADGGGSEDLLSPLAAESSGGAPRVLASPPGQDAAFLAQLVRDELERDRMPPQNVAVLCFRVRRSASVLEALSNAGVLCRRHDATSGFRLTDPEVKVMTMHSAKGLEFPAVYLLVSARDVKVPAALTDPGDRRSFLVRARKVLYMAMTRALKRLTIVHDGAGGSPVEALLGRGEPQ